MTAQPAAEQFIGPAAPAATPKTTRKTGIAKPKPAPEAAPKPEAPAPAEVVKQNGITRPRAGGKCDAVWCALDRLTGTDAPMTNKQARALSVELGINPSTMGVQFGKWRKFHGISGQ